MGNANAKPRGGVTHFGRLNALRDKGWLGVLTKNELQLWHCYESHADYKSGVSYPDSKQLSDYIGHQSNNNIARIRRCLVGYGLLEVIEVGGGRGHPCKVRVLVPEKAAPESKKEMRNRLRKPLQTPLILRVFSENKDSQNSQERLSKTVVKDSQNEQSLNKEEHIIEHIKNTPARGGLLQTQIGGGFGDDEAGIKKQIFNADLEWTQTGLAPHLSSSQFRKSLAAFALHLNEIGKLSGGSWRKKLEALSKMTQARAIAALEYSLCGGYQQIVEPQASRARDSPSAERRGPLEKSQQYE